MIIFGIFTNVGSPTLVFVFGGISVFDTGNNFEDAGILVFALSANDVAVSAKGVGVIFNVDSSAFSEAEGFVMRESWLLGAAVQEHPAGLEASGASWEALDAYDQEASCEVSSSRSRLPRKSTATSREYTPEQLAPLKGMHHRSQASNVESKHETGRLSEVLLRQQRRGVRPP
ncbi:hypothetical protein ACJJTC_003355 [Scirpophaga incertulas]